MPKKVFILLLIAVQSACSTTGGIYDKDDAQNAEFSLGRTLLTVAAVAATVSVARRGGGGGSQEETFI